MKVYISSDHAGFELKNKLNEVLRQRGVAVDDIGPFSLEPEDDYPAFAFALSEQVAREYGSFGVLVCRSGQGMCIAANKVKGIRAGLCTTPEAVKIAREHNHINVLVLESQQHSESDLSLLMNAFLETAPGEGRHARRVEQISKYENDHFRA